MIKKYLTKTLVVLIAVRVMWAGMDLSRRTVPALNRSAAWSI
jgi:hypothetical protein